MKGKQRLYIAYGSNLNLEQMAFRCPTAKVVGKSELKDYELLFRGGRRGAVATVEPKAGSTVPVLIWEIQNRDEASLDLYEGYPSFWRTQSNMLISLYRNRKERDASISRACFIWGAMME